MENKKSDVSPKKLSLVIIIWRVNNEEEDERYDYTALVNCEHGENDEAGFRQCKETMWLVLLRNTLQRKWLVLLAPQVL